MDSVIHSQDHQVVVGPHQRSVLLVGCMLLVALPLLVMQPEKHWAQEPELLVLMKSMAVIKATIALVALAAVFWRLGHGPLGKPIRLSYVASIWLMALAIGMIWQLTFIVGASLLFHAGTLMLLVTTWRDLEPLATRQLGKNHGQRPAKGYRTGQRTDQRVARRAIHPAAGQAVNQEVWDDHDGNDQQEEQLLKRQRYGQA